MFLFNYNYIQLYVLLVALMAEAVLHLECVRVPLSGLETTVLKVYNKL